MNDVYIGKAERERLRGRYLNPTFEVADNEEALRNITAYANAVANVLGRTLKALDTLDDIADLLENKLYHSVPPGVGPPYVVVRLRKLREAAAQGSEAVPLKIAVDVAAKDTLPLQMDTKGRLLLKCPSCDREGTSSVKWDEEKKA